MKQPAIFVDRDGTLIEEVNYLSRVEDLRIFPFTGPALRLLKESGFLIIVVTNQSGIAREVYTEAAMHIVHDQIQADLGGAIDGFYFCPHLPDAGCSCRKPNLGMIEAARSDFDIDMERSWVIGDKDLDVNLGKKAGTGTVMVMTGYGRKHKPFLEFDPDVFAEDLGQAAERVVETNPPASVIT
jgi:D-glycero-D-manno-heptose 1,7-bisphosphate phosphatase